MNINRENYEIFFLDYHEGLLEPGQVAEMLVFLEANPDLKEEFGEFGDFENIVVTPDLSISFADKTSLKKNNVTDFGPINASNYETYFIADTERQLTSKEQLCLAGFLQHNPELNTAYKLFFKTRLQPDMQIQYPNKEGLKRSIFNTRRFYYYALSTAASMALLFAVYMNTGIKQEPMLTAQQKTSNLPAPDHKNNSQAIPQQKISTPAVAPNTQIATYTAATTKVSEQALAAHEQTPGERKSITAIQARLEAQITSRDLVEPAYLFIRQSKNKPETYATLYDQINLAERMQNEQVLAPVVNSPKSLLREGLGKLACIFTGKEAPANPGTINFWTLADLGISGYNLLTDKDLRLLTQTNDSGKVVSYALKSDEFEFMRLKNKPKNQ